MTKQQQAIADAIASKELIDPLEETYGLEMAQNIMGKSCKVLAATYAAWLMTCASAEEANAVLEFVGKTLLLAGRVRDAGADAEGNPKMPEMDGFEA